MAVIKVNSSLTYEQKEDVEKFSVASGVGVDMSEVIIIDEENTSALGVMSDITGGRLVFDGREYYIMMCATDKDGNNLAADGTVASGDNPADFKDLEYDFKGLKYMSMKGLDAIGKPKIYVEEYADSEVLRTYIPKELKNSPTDCELTLAFVGSQRYKAYSLFNDYIRQGYHRYLDTKRLKGFLFFIDEAVEPSEEVWKGSVPYLQVTYKLRGIKGYSA